LIFLKRNSTNLGMGRPKKSEMGSITTRERLFNKALELFATKGFDAVSVRDITGALGLNEATLYIHYSNKLALLEAILQRLEKKLIEPGFKIPPPEFFRGQSTFDLTDYLIDGAKQFFGRADTETLLTWRMLMISQYRYESARRSVEEQLLNAPVRFFTKMLRRTQIAELIRQDIECESAGRIIAALFFDFSFRANLKEAWNEQSEDEFERLAEELRFFTRSLEV